MSHLMKFKFSKLTFPSSTIFNFDQYWGSEISILLICSFLVNLIQIFDNFCRNIRGQNVRKSYQHTAAAARVHSSSSRLAKGFSNWRKVLFSAKLNLTESRIAFKLSYIHYTILYRAKEAILKTQIFWKENLLRKWNHRKSDTHFAFYRNKNVVVQND